MTLTSRERVLLALNHQEPDRVPIVFGADGSTAMLVPAYENLKRTDFSAVNLKNGMIFAFLK